MGNVKFIKISGIPSSQAEANGNEVAGDRKKPCDPNESRPY
jgi:hypothetical protein